jgi:hypothetical protein
MNKNPEDFSEEDFELLQERVKNLKLQALFEEPCSWEDDDE